MISRSIKVDYWIFIEVRITFKTKMKFYIEKLPFQFNPGCITS